jgi:uncharacterized protein YndB with AHSA1/START domain
MSSDAAQRSATTADSTASAHDTSPASKGATPGDRAPATAPTPEDALRTTPTVSGSPPAGRSISCEIRTTATPEQAWEAWANPDKLAHWFVDRAYGDVRPGGVMTWVFDEFKYEIPYPVLEARAPARLVFGGEIPGYPPFRLEISIASKGGETVVHLFNSGFREGAQWDEEFQGVDSGWRLALALLRHYLEHHYDTPKRAVLALRPADFDYAEILPWFTDESRLSRWLTTSGAVGRPGAPVSLALRGGQTVRGTVLATTRHEVALSWTDASMVLELKAFNMGPETRVVAVRATGWGVPEERMTELERELETALERLATALRSEQ